jgi:2-succinyl-6-hydroxy-2,4-cyclohexadiene-1-carboxylate synthase
MQRVRVNGIEIAFEEHGTGTRPLVLLHGFTGYRQDFATQLGALAAHGRLIVPDLRGHGDSAHAGDPADYTLDHLRVDLVALLDALDVERCDLLGHSMGGMVALRAALAHADRIDSLLLMDTAPGPLAWVNRDQLALATRVALEAGMQSLATILRARAKDDPDRGAPDRRLEERWGEERFWAWRESRIAAMDPHAYAAFGLALVEQEDLTARLRDIAAPTTVLVGELDREFRAPAEVLAREIPDAMLVVLPEGGHQPQHEAPAAWLAAVTAHLTRARG